MRELEGLLGCRAVAGQGAATKTWLGFLFQRNPSLELQLCHVWCGPGDEVTGADGIYLLTSFGPEGTPWRGRGARGVSCCAPGFRLEFFRNSWVRERKGSCSPGFLVAGADLLWSGCQEEQCCGCFACAGLCGDVLAHSECLSCQPLVLVMWGGSGFPSVAV